MFSELRVASVETPYSDLKYNLWATGTIGTCDWAQILFAFGYKLGLRIISKTFPVVQELTLSQAACTSGHHQCLLSLGAYKRRSGGVLSIMPEAGSEGD